MCSERFAEALRLGAGPGGGLLRVPVWPVTIAHYPPQKVAPAEDKERIQAHWDRTLFSLITTSGLKRQVKLVGNRVFHLVKCHSIFYFIQS